MMVLAIGNSVQMKFTMTDTFAREFIWVTYDCMNRGAGSLLRIRAGCGLAYFPEFCSEFPWPCRAWRVAGHGVPDPMGGAGKAPNPNGNMVPQCPYTDCDVYVPIRILRSAGTATDAVFYYRSRHRSKPCNTAAPRIVDKKY